MFAPSSSASSTCRPRRSPSWSTSFPTTSALLMMALALILCLALDAAHAAPAPEAIGGHPGAVDDLPEELAEMLRRDPSYVMGIIEQLQGGYRKPMENTKRGIDFGLGRGYSGNQAAKHMMGLVASQYAGGPGKRKRGGVQNYELPSVYYNHH